MDYRLQSVVPA